VFLSLVLSLKWLIRRKRTTAVKTAVRLKLAGTYKPTNPYKLARAFHTVRA
jgi:hypothetical protein